MLKLVCSQCHQPVPIAEGLRIDVEKRRLYYNHKVAYLSKSQIKFMAAMVKNGINKPVSIEAIYNEMWDNYTPECDLPNLESIKVHKFSVQRELKKQGIDLIIEPIRQFGYILSDSTGNSLSEEQCKTLAREMKRRRT